MRDENGVHVTLKQYITDILDEREKRYQGQLVDREKAIAAALAAAEKAVAVAEVNSQRWRDSANEWRGAMTDKDRNFVTKSAMWGYFVSAIGVAVILVELVEKLFIK